MQADTQAAPVSKAALWTGYVLSALPALLLIFSAMMKFIQPEGFEKGVTDLGWKVEVMKGLGVVELACAIIYLIPQTAALGAILMTGYLGGAIATHVRLGEPVYMHVILGVMVWLGLYLRDRRVRGLIPLR